MRSSRCKTFFVIVVALLLFPVGPSHALDDRVALVIGNAAYPDMPLRNPRNDAEAISSALQDAGFDVITALDADLEAMQQAMLEFATRINRKSTALVFYAGHGVQVDGRNYLLPVDAQISSERELKFKSLELRDVLDELESAGARINIVILDACRNNPFERSMRGAGRGLAAVDAAQGTLIAYATAPGSTAADGEGNNGLYTGALLKALQKADLKVEEVFKKVRIDVADASGGAQIPWESSSLTGDFVFRPKTPALTSQPDVPPQIQQQPTKTAPNQCDDLSGRWANSVQGPAACPPPIINFTRAGENVYDVEGTGCMVPMTGTAKLEGKTLSLKWRMTPCSGETNYVMDANCDSGTGPLRITPSLLCADSKNTGFIQRTTH